MNATIVPVILSGGSGTRLWPVSRRGFPKPFMRLPDGETMIEKTARRALAACPGTPRLYTVTAREHQFLTADEYTKVLPEGVRSRLLLEPVGRNTAPAVVMAALAIEADIGRDALMLVLAADHLIRDQASFDASVRAAATLAHAGDLVTFGIVPTRPETGYGYIERGVGLGDAGFRVVRFVEKPDRATAEGYLAAGSFLWNSGMFCFRAGTVLDAAAASCPDVLAACRRVFTGVDTSADVISFDQEAFAAIPDISFDYAVMERAPNRAVVPATFDWSDVGSWREVAEQVEADARGNRIRGDALVVASDDTYVHAESRTVAVLGVSGLSVIETRDAVLVTHRDHAQDVKRVVEQLRARSAPVTEHHQTVQRPWGSYTVLEDADDCKVKRLTVKPGGVLSLQYHHRRSEHWTVVAGTAKVRVGEDEFLLERGQSVHIPQGSLHRLENPTDRDLHLVEVQCGEYFGEDDIVRLEDRYGRAPKA
jgi:mannose-1-phosphate guanylyltransferase/mannose-6-phosphate isomerase